MASNEPQLARKHSRRFALGALLIGVALFALSFLPALAGGRDRWTTEEAREYQATSLKIQELTHQLGTQTPDTTSRDTSLEFKQALDHFAELQGKLQSARARTAIWPTTLRVVGLVFGLAGIASFWSTVEKLE